MSPNELKILRLAQELERLDKVTVSRKMDVSTDYADWLLKSLCRQRCLEPNGSGAKSVYVFTEEGRVCLLGDLLQLRAALETRIDHLSYQTDRLGEKIQALALREAEETESAEFEAEAMIPVGSAT